MPHLLLLVTYHTKLGVREEFLSEVRTSGLLDQIRSQQIVTHEVPPSSRDILSRSGARPFHGRSFCQKR